MPDIFSIKVILGLTASIIALISYVPYFLDIFKGKTKPHAFSWLVWGVLTAIGYAGQVADHGGAGTWVTGITAIVCFAIFFTAIFRGERNITKSDWGCLTVAFAAIPLWVLTKTPLWSMIVITLIDAVGFFPTVRKSYYKPFEETAITYVVSTLKFVIALIALETFSAVTVLYPASLVIMNGGFVVMLYVRRRGLKSPV